MSGKSPILYLSVLFVPPLCLCGFLKNCLKIRTLFSNTHNMNRKQFLSRTTGAGLIMAAPFSFLPASPVQSDDPIDPKLVYEFVRLAHSEYDTVVAMHKEHPTLLNCAWDWKNGDFETALGAASHIGNKQIATYLLEQGAQANIFTACLFGHLHIVKAMIEAFPNTLHAKGPHGFTLLHHAIKGGEEAEEVVEYLKRLGAKEMRVELG